MKQDHRYVQLSLFMKLEGKYQMKPEMIRKACELIENNLANPDLGVSWVANQLGADLISFSRSFSRTTGMQCSKYIASRRIERAKEALNDHRLRITEVAACVGFKDANYFTRVFKRMVGVSPAIYRKRLQRGRLQSS